jgi:hypothetical protein
MLSQKVSGTTVGMWLLIPEMQRLGVWDLLKGWTGGQNTDFDPRIALQLVNESALCINRVRKKNSLGHQGFQLANGMGRLVTDEQVHNLLNKHSIDQAEELLVNLGYQRQLCGHYKGGLIAVDPHRIISTSKRIMAKKKKRSDSPAQKMIQTFFSVCAQTGQPIMASIASTGMPTTKATKKLLSGTEKIIQNKALLLADKEHFTQDLLTTAKNHLRFDILTPALNTQRIQKQIQQLDYKPLWAGFAISETNYYFHGNKEVFRLIAERTGENRRDYEYKAFITTSDRGARELISDNYDERWSVENYFNFESSIGLNRASTLNLNIRYGKLAMSLMAQAVTYQLRKRLNNQYKNWNASHLALEVLAWADGDIRVKDDTIIVTFYGAPNHINPKDYTGLPKILRNEGIDPCVPWLFGYKLDFRFK